MLIKQYANKQTYKDIKNLHPTITRTTHNNDTIYGNSSVSSGLHKKVTTQTFIRSPFSI